MCICYAELCAALTAVLFSFLFSPSGVRETSFFSGLPSLLLTSQSVVPLQGLVSVLVQALVWLQKGHRHTWQPSSAERIEDRTLRTLLVRASGICSSRLMVETHSRIGPFRPATDLSLLKLPVGNVRMPLERPEL